MSTPSPTISTKGRLRHRAPVLRGGLPARVPGKGDQDEHHGDTTIPRIVQTGRAPIGGTSGSGGRPFPAKARSSSDATYSYTLDQQPDSAPQVSRRPVRSPFRSSGPQADPCVAPTLITGPNLPLRSPDPQSKVTTAYWLLNTSRSVTVPTNAPSLFAIPLRTPSRAQRSRRWRGEPATTRPAALREARARRRDRRRRQSPGGRRAGSSRGPKHFARIERGPTAYSGPPRPADGGRGAPDE